MKEINKLKPFTKFCCSIGNIPTSYMLSLSYEEQLLWLCDFLKNTVIPTVNNNGEAVEELQNLYTQLKNYVDNYFENLDVQTEINNKLDEMALDGTLDLIIGSYVDNYIEETNTRLNNMETSIENIKDRKNGILAISRSINNADHHLYYSQNGKDFIQVGEKITALTSDASNIIKIGKYYYYFGNNTYQKSEDLINWSNSITLVESPLSRVWASFPYYDENSETLYIYESYQYKSDEDTFTNATGFTSYYFKIQYHTATINEDGSLNINSQLNDLLYVDDESYIDASVIHDNIYGYLLAVKNEKTTRIEIYQMNSLTSVNTKRLTLRMVGVEAPKLLTDNNGNIVCYMQDYSMIRNSLNPINSAIQTYCYCGISDTKHFYTEQQITLEITNSIFPFRHAGLMYCDGNTNYLLEKIGIKPQCLLSSNDYTIGKGYKYLSVVNGCTIINYPNIIYIFGGGHVNPRNITIKQYFKDVPLKFVVTDCYVVYNENSDVQPVAKGQSYIHNPTGGIENLTYNVYPRSENANYGFMMPYNK